MQKREKVNIIGMPVLLTTIMPIMRNVVEILRGEELKGRIKTIIGGIPVSRRICERDRC